MPSTKIPQDEKRAKRLQQQKAWRDANKGRIAIAMKEWRTKNKIHIAKYTEAYRSDNAEYQNWKREYGKRYYQTVIKNDKQQLAQRQRYREAYDKAHPEQRKAISDRYRQSNRKLLAEKAKTAYHAKPADERKALRLARGEYYRQWREDHKDQLRDRNKQYRTENAQDIAAVARIHYLANRERLLEEQKARYKRNPEPHKERTAKWHKENPEKRREHARKWDAKHPEAKRARVAARRARFRNAEGTYTENDISRLFTEQHGCCTACAKDLGKQFEVDHILALFLGGSNWPDNLQLLCRTCNRRKGHMTPEQWAARIGKLFN